MADDRANDPKRQISGTLSRFGDYNTDIPGQQDFSSAALAGHKKTKISSSVTKIEPRGGIIPPISAASYNKTSSELAEARKSGAAAKHDAARREKANAGKPKGTIKINTNPVKGK